MNTPPQIKAELAEILATIDFEGGEDYVATYIEHAGYPAGVREVFDAPAYMREFPKGSVATCGECDRSWDDNYASAWTPTPGARCPFEYDHDIITKVKAFRQYVWETSSDDIIDDQETLDDALTDYVEQEDLSKRDFDQILERLSSRGWD